MFKLWDFFPFVMYRDLFKYSSKMNRLNYERALTCGLVIGWGDIFAFIFFSALPAKQVNVSLPDITMGLLGKKKFSSCMGE
ncbi:hypothetical protein T12_14204 [Trichinella patagoniensis]|uniref:Uncharacterized protein n=1 Tax=Trichinella patagoniensis TaxID=990121 RepID=A0A0V1A1T6_9BILA|nr:hypothetical protein T12_14204 [Trichinella patagoniensis]